MAHVLPPDVWANAAMPLAIVASVTRAASVQQATAHPTELAKTIQAIAEPATPPKSDVPTTRASHPVSRAGDVAILCDVA